MLSSLILSRVLRSKMFFQLAKRTKPCAAEPVDYRPLVQRLCQLLQVPEPSAREFEQLLEKVKTPADLTGVCDVLEQGVAAKKKNERKLFVDPGHYYSPIVDPAILKQPWKRNSTLDPNKLPGISISREQHV